MSLLRGNARRRKYLLVCEIIEDWKEHWIKLGNTEIRIASLYFGLKHFKSCAFVLKTAESNLWVNGSLEFQFLISDSIGYKLSCKQWQYSFGSDKIDPLYHSKLRRASLFCHCVYIIIIYVLRWMDFHFYESCETFMWFILNLQILRPLLPSKMLHPYFRMEMAWMSLKLKKQWSANREKEQSETKLV